MGAAEQTSVSHNLQPVILVPYATSGNRGNLTEQTKEWHGKKHQTKTRDIRRRKKKDRDCEVSEGEEEGSIDRTFVGRD